MIDKPMDQRKVCPVCGCGKVFKGPGWTGIDGDWRSKRVGHEDIESYEDARCRLLTDSWEPPEKRTLMDK